MRICPLYYGRKRGKDKGKLRNLEWDIPPVCPYGTYRGSFQDECFSEICVHTQDSYVASRLLKLEETAGEGWRDSKGELIKNAAEWEQVYRLIHAFPEAHKMTAQFEKHSYSTWLQEMMKKNECGRIMGQGLESATRAESNDNGVSRDDCP